jgi:hypothetical protein
MYTDPLPRNASQYPCEHARFTTLIAASGDRCCSPFDKRPQKTEKCTNSWWGRAHTEKHRRASPYQRSSNTSCRTCDLEDSLAGSALKFATHKPFVQFSSVQFRRRQWFSMSELVLLGLFCRPITFCHVDSVALLTGTCRGHSATVTGDCPVGYTTEHVVYAWWCPSQYSYAARNYLVTAYTGRWVGRQGPVSWPSRSSDLNPLDFLLRCKLQLWRL